MHNSMTAEICELLDKEHFLFLQYERETFGIAAESEEIIPEHMGERSRLQEEIQWILQEIASICDKAPDRELLSGAVANSLPRAELPETYGDIFDKAMSIRSVMKRIQELEPQAMERMEAARDDFLEKIKFMNQGKEAAVSKYYRSTSPRSGGEQRTFKKV